ncbi:tetratricopeptide repeat protein [Exilibacterium tricleocarpae]|uniref:Tetratricopeptide repeat protein n=1 Tax=Exilibacterium tricleocarpae TaxID=2591008 RepID=A0A545TKA4_9GAMM|nr:tetratricopeptide repeat protein [Exilibacterium tricleocarpae]TQV77638.1 tetratricopeptide repeat protein [Exilibacterium tricleocarpae]
MTASTVTSASIIRNVKRLLRHSLLALPLAMVPALGSVVMQELGQEGFTAGSAFAQQDEKQKPKYKTRKTPALRESVFKKFAVVQELVSPEEEGAKPNFPKALEELKDIQKGTDKFNKYEKAQLYNYFGFVYYTLENYKEAIRYYKLVVAQSPEIPIGLEQGTMYTIAQLYFVLEDYPNAIKALLAWMEVAPIVGSDSHILLAQAYYQSNQMGPALKHTNIAIDDWEGRNKIPKENWYSLQRALYYDKNDYKKVINILEKMVRHYPKMTYWRQLAGMYGSVNREKDQLYAMEALYVMGGLNKEKELLNLAYLLMGEEVPYKAAKVVGKGLKDKIVEPTSKNLEFYAQALRLAQEVEDSIPVMARAARKSDKGDLFARLAGIYLDNDQNKEALEAAADAIKKGGVKRMDQLYVVQGMARANLGRYEAALKDFNQCAKDKRSKKTCTQWAKYIESEIKREKQLAAS